MFFKFFKETPQSEAERTLEAITAMLFPPLVVKTDQKGNKYHIDHSADSNLEAALNDLEDGHNDRVTQNTVRKIADRLYNVRKLVNAYNDIDPEAQYYVIDVTEEEESDAIVTAEDELQ